MLTTNATTTLLTVDTLENLNVLIFTRTVPEEDSQKQSSQFQMKSGFVSLKESNQQQQLDRTAGNQSIHLDTPFNKLLRDKYFPSARGTCKASPLNA